MTFLIFLKKYLFKRQIHGEGYKDEREEKRGRGTGERHRGVRETGGGGGGEEKEEKKEKKKKRSRRGGERERKKERKGERRSEEKKIDLQTAVFTPQMAAMAKDDFFFFLKDYVKDLFPLLDCAPCTWHWPGVFLPGGHLGAVPRDEKTVCVCVGESLALSNCLSN